MMKYSVPPFSMDEIIKLDVNLLSCPLPGSPPVWSIAEYLPADATNVDTINFDDDFTLSASIWLSREIGDGEGGIISRDDGFRRAQHIDWEYACSEADGDTFLRARAAHIRPRFVLDTTLPWSAAHDWYQVGLLLSGVPGMVIEYPLLKTLREMLLSKSFSVAAVQKLVDQLNLKE
eukprot:gene9278-10935_t